MHLREHGLLGFGYEAADDEARRLIEGRIPREAGALSKVLDHGDDLVALARQYRRVLPRMNGDIAIGNGHCQH